MTTKSKKTGTEMTVLTPGNLPAVPSVLEQLKAELEGLKSITETQYQTNGSIDGFPKGIQEETSVENLVKMHSSVGSKKRAYDISLKDLGIAEAPVFKMNGFSLEAITFDIKLKIAVIQHADRKKELEDLIKEGEQFLTKDDQYAMYQAKIAKFVGTK